MTGPESATFEPPADGWRDILIELLAVMDTPTRGEAIAQLGKLTDEVDVRARVSPVGRLMTTAKAKPADAKKAAR